MDCSCRRRETNFPTINALLTSMRNNTGNYTQDGIIYFTSNPGASFSLTTARSSLGSGDFDMLNDFNKRKRDDGATRRPSFSAQRKARRLNSASAYPFAETE